MSTSSAPRDVHYIEGIGRRKTAIARVRLYPVGSMSGTPGGKATSTFVVNGRAFNEYFPIVDLQVPVKEPFDTTGTWGAFDVSVHVRGGGIHAQAGAIRLGAARSLLKTNEAYRKSFRASGQLTRDPREKERKKPGLKRARRAPQWQKR